MQEAAAVHGRQKMQSGLRETDPEELYRPDCIKKGIPRTEYGETAERGWEERYFAGFYKIRFIVFFVWIKLWVMSYAPGRALSWMRRR